MQLGLLAFGVELAEVEQKLEGVIANFEIVGVSPLKLAGLLRTTAFFSHPPSLPLAFGLQVVHQRHQGRILDRIGERHSPATPAFLHRQGVLVIVSSSWWRSEEHTSELQSPLNLVC